MYCQHGGRPPYQPSAGDLFFRYHSFLLRYPCKIISNRQPIIPGAGRIKTLEIEIRTIGKVPVPLLGKDVDKIECNRHSLIKEFSHNARIHTPVPPRISLRIGKPVDGKAGGKIPDILWCKG